MHRATTIDLFGLDLMSAAQEQAIARLLDGVERRSAAFVNAHCVNVAMREPEYARFLQSTGTLLPDGSGLELAARLTGRSFHTNLNGTDLFLPLCRGAAERNLSLFLFGGRPGVAERTAETARSEVPRLGIAGTANGYFEDGDDARVIEQINRSGADVVLVALGVPLQELWIARNRHRLKARLVVGVGAQFDFWAGDVTRAPKILRRTGLEWLWRLGLEPKRMFSRYVIGNPIFIARAMKHALYWHGSEVLRTSDPKRVFDVLLSSFGLVLIAPVMLLVAASIRLESTGPVFVRKRRIGQNGREFHLISFRCSRNRAPNHVTSDMSTEAATATSGLKTDPAATRIGRLIQRTSLDGLPQLFNVLKGDMSIVGPEPTMPQDTLVFSTRALARFAVKPGITGLWRLSGNSDTGFQKRVELDVAYAQSRSMLLDLVLLALTIRTFVVQATSLLWPTRSAVARSGSEVTRRPQASST